MMSWCNIVLADITVCDAEWNPHELVLNSNLPRNIIRNIIPFISIIKQFINTFISKISMNLERFLLLVGYENVKAHLINFETGFLKC